MERILIIGATGLLGSHLAVALREDHCVYGTYYSRHIPIKGVPLFHVDVLKEKSLFDVLLRIRPTLVLYASAIRNEQACSEQALAALTVNAEAASDIALSLRPTGGRLIYFSSSKVFSGNKGNYSEDDPPDPCSSYGSSKRRAEELLLDFENTFVLRLGTLFGLGLKKEDSLLARLLEQLWAKHPLTLIEDEYRSFQGVDAVEAAVRSLMHSDPDKAGLYNCPGGARSSYYDFVRVLAESLGVEATLERMPSSALRLPYNTPEIRGEDTTLAPDKFRRAFGLDGPSLSESIETIKKQLLTCDF